MNDDLDDTIWASGLNDGEYVCDQCKGFGLINLKEGIEPIFDSISGHSFSWKQCPKCEGNGKIDWARYARGKM